jgi:hypothetical protein
MANIKCGGWNAVMEAISVTVADQRDNRTTASEQETMKKRATPTTKDMWRICLCKYNFLKRLERVRAT